MGNLASKMLLSSEEILAIEYALVDNLDQLIEQLDVPLTKIHNGYVGACPCHFSRKSSAFSLNDATHEYPGRWTCWTNNNQCADTFKQSLLGLIRGKLSHDELLWNSEGDETVSFGRSLAWAIEFLGGKPDIKPRKVIKSIPKPNSYAGVSRDYVIKSLEIPSEYFLRRGFSEGLLRQYCIGDCTRKGKEFYGRAVVPLFDKTLTQIVGVTGRSLWRQCPACNLYHDGECPEVYHARYAKWRHSAGFDKKRYLFNYYNNIEVIRSTKSIILVESPGNALRLQDAGYCAVALFGTSLAQSQKLLLDEAGVTNISLLMDADDAGKKASERLYKGLNLSYNVRVLNVPDGHNDVGEISPGDIKKWLRSM